MRLKDVVVGILFVLAIITVLGISGYFETHYSIVAEVTSVDDTGTIFVDAAGYVWASYDTNFRKGQFVKLDFFNNTTDYTRNDDVIVRARLLND